MKKISVLLVVLFLLSPLYARDIQCEKVVSYNIDATLDVSAKLINGRINLSWTNRGATATQEMYFHLYWNAFKNTQSTFFKDAPLGEYTAKLIDRFEKGGWGFCDVLSMTAQSDGLFQSTTLAPIFVQPDDDNAADETVFKVELPTAVAPGKTVQLDIDFQSQVPYRAPRTGYTGDYFFIAQWFPKLGVWNDDTWNCHQFHATSEFFADYGDYDVRLTVPSGFVVGATGVQTDSTRNENGTTSYRYQEQCIHDFAWTAYPNFKVAVRLFEHEDLPPVEMRLLYQPEHQKYVDVYFEATENTLKYLGTWYVPYPYSHITIVDAAWRSASGGMEYPTLFTTEVDWLEAEGSLHPRGVTVHECTHQFFYGILGSNEFENAWMDEGFATYATARCMNTAYGPGSFSKTYLEREGFGVPKTFKFVARDQRDWMVTNNRERGSLDFMDKKSWEYVTYEAYRNNAYEKPALMLWTLEGYLGEALFSEILKTYATRWAFKHPKPRDFFDVVNEFAPENMDWFFDQIMKDAATLDYAVDKIVSKSAPPVQGLFGFGAEKSKKDDTAKDSKIMSQVHVKRLGGFIMPVDVLVTFENGETETVLWNGQETHRVFEFVSEAHIEKVEIDPYRKLWLDTNPNNNSMFREAERFLAFRWGAAWLFWLQDVLEMVAIFS